MGRNYAVLAQEKGTHDVNMLEMSKNKAMVKNAKKMMSKKVLRTGKK